MKRQYVYWNCLLTEFDVMNFEVNLIFQIKLFFLHDQNVATKYLILRTKKLLRRNKHF